MDLGLKGKRALVSGSSADISAQLLAKLSRRIAIKSALRKLTDVFVVSNIVWAQTSGYDVLMIARILGTYAFGIISTMHLVPLQVLSPDCRSKHRSDRISRSASS